MMGIKKSFWEDDVFYAHQDLIIIGAGIVGLNAALAAKELNPEKSVLVMDRGQIPLGASTRNAGFACFGSVTEILADLQGQNSDFVYETIKRRWEGLKFLRKRVPDEKMDYTNQGGFEIFNKNQDLDTIESSLAGLNEDILAATGLENCFVWKEQVFGLNAQEKVLYNAYEGALHPAKLIKYLIRECASRGVQLLTNCEITKIDHEDHQVKLQTASGHSFTADQLIVATNAFTPKLIPELDIKPARNQVIVTNEITGLKLKGCFHFSEGYYYFRNIGNRVLLGGARIIDEEAEETDSFGLSDTIQGELKRFMSEIVLPHQKWETDYAWSGIMGVGQNKSPILEKINSRTTLAVRLGGMGIAIGAWVGTKAAEIALTK